MSHYTHHQKVNLLLHENPSLCTLKPTHSNTLRNGSYKKGSRKLNLSSFNQILEVGPDYVDVEPKVTMSQLVDSLFPLIPPVLPEFPSITVGGAIMGAALESSSFKYGQFNDCCIEYDILIGDKLYTVSREKNPDLFWGVSGSYGTLGILTRARLRLIKAKRSIHLKMIESDPLPIFANPPDCDFLDAVRFRDRDVVMIGTFCDYESTNKLRPDGPWFYQQLFPGEMILPTKDYLFRFDRGAFWMGRYLLSKKMILHALLRQSPKKTIAEIESDPPPLFHKTLGRLCTSKLLYKALHTIPEKMIRESFFIHDFYMRPDCVELFLKKNQIDPIWLCPVKGSFEPQFLAPHYGAQHFVNVGLYGPFQESLDSFCAQLGGRKMLYSSTDLERPFFEKIYFEERYLSLRKKFSAEKKFPHLYDKVTWNRASTLQKTITSATT